jgi:uncharacterized protein
VDLRRQLAVDVTRSLGLAIVLAWLTLARLGAQSLPTITAPVNDFAHVISPTIAAELDRQIRALQSTTGDAVVVVTVDTFAPYGSIEEYAVKLFEKAGVGQRPSDNGALIVLAMKEHRVRIEVGYGLEQFITDGFSGETIRQLMLPEFRNGRYDAGLLAGTTRVIERIAEGRGQTLQNMPAPVARNRSGSGGAIVVPILFVIIVLLRIASRLSSGPGIGPRVWRGPWSGWSGGIGGFGGGGFGGFGGGGGGGGFGGFGGGMSGGGGASGSW